MGRRTVGGQDRLVPRLSGSGLGTDQRVRRKIPAGKRMSLLTLSNIEVAYDKVFLAIKGVSLEVEEGAVVALLGANGAGKSTTLKTVSGLLAPERGAVNRGHLTFKNERIDEYSPPHRVRMGLVHVLEGRHIFEHLTPNDNLLAAYPGRHAKKSFSELR